MKLPLTSRIQHLQDRLSQSRQSQDINTNPQSSSPQSNQNQKYSPCKSRQNIAAKTRYINLTNMTKLQRKQLVWQELKIAREQKKAWSYSFYLGNNINCPIEKTFSKVFDKSQLEQYPDNNKKYNVQFLERSLQGGGFKLPKCGSGEFRKPSDNLYTRHYRSIIKEKVKFNEDWELRASLFGKTDVDRKRDRIIKAYTLQMNTFKTPRSNSLLSQVTKSHNY